MSVYAEVTPQGLVVNLVEWDGVAPYNVTPNTLVAATGQPNAQIGGTYLGGVFTAPPTPALAQGILFLNSPASGASIALPSAPQPQATLYAILQPAAALGALTLTASPTPEDGDELYVLSTKAIAAVTFTPSPGQSLINIPTPLALAAGVSVHCTWSAQLGAWFRL
jgi:hypothetical protein